MLLPTPIICPTFFPPVLKILLVKSVPFCLLAKAADRPSGSEAQVPGLEFALFKGTLWPEVC